MKKMMDYALDLMDTPHRRIDIGIVIVSPRRQPFLSHYLDTLRPATTISSKYRHIVADSDLHWCEEVRDGDGDVV